MSVLSQQVEREKGFGRSALRAAAAMALGASILIIVGGAVVRVTGSGLGCPTWPSCTVDAFAPTPEMDVHGLIEFGNRLLTGLVCVVVGWLIVVARLQRQPAPRVRRWAWVQFWVIVANAVVGGITVLARLSPYVVAAHLLAAAALLAAATATWHEVRRLDAPDGLAPSPRVRRLGAALLAATSLLLVAGTVVTGTGPHAGDSSNVERMPFHWSTTVLVHAVTAVAVLVTAVALWFAAGGDVRRSALRRRVALLLGVFVAQGSIGVIGTATSLPAVTVVLHVLGATLVWIGAIRVYLGTRP